MPTAMQVKLKVSVQLMNEVQVVSESYKMEGTYISHLLIRMWSSLHSQLLKRLCLS